MKRALIVMLLATSCYSPSLHSGQYQCSDGKCPRGWQCNACHVCVEPERAGDVCDVVDMSVSNDLSVNDDLPSAPDLHAADLAVSIDLTASPDLTFSPDLTPTPDLTPVVDLLPPPPDLTPLFSPCTNGGVRAPLDPGLPELAFCPAAWLVPGVVTSAGMMTPCNRMPTANGKSASDTNCSAEDNCATGWHICANQVDASGRGLTRAMCTFTTDATTTGSLYITRQPGGPPGTPGAPTCDSQQRTLFGCGTFGNLTATDTCTVFARGLVDAPNGGDDCSTTSTGAFLCPGVGGSAGEQSVVTKPLIDRGGVICCKN